MVAIPPYQDPTLKAMRIAIEGEPRTQRTYIGASSIGNPCARQIWYGYKGYNRTPFTADTLMRFEDGHRTEDLTAKRLRMVKGIELQTHNDSGEQLGFSALGGEFKGHYDGIIYGLLQAPNAPHIWECKASGEKQFKNFQTVKAKSGDKDTLRNWNATYYAQAQVYMHYSGIDRHYLTISLSGGREYDSCRTNYDEIIAHRYIERAQRIIDAKNPPQRVKDDAEYYLCNWCDFKEVCYDV